VTSPDPESCAPAVGPPLWLQVAAAIFCRLVLNTARRFPYPFAPALSRGLDVPLTWVTTLIAGTQATALVGAVSGPLTDRVGTQAVMAAGLALLVAGMIAAGALPFYSMVAAALLLAALGKTLFDPAIQAFVGHRVPFTRRGLVVGLLEFSWSGCTLVGIPVIGLLMTRWGWRSPFFVLGALGGLGLFALRLLPDQERQRARSRDAQGLWHVLRHLAAQPQALGTLGYVFLVSLANDNFFVVYGAWFESAFHLSIAALGFSTVAIGVAELLGESLTAWLGDRVGLKRAVIAGLCITIICYALLPLAQHSMLWALACMFALFLSFEFTIVSSISLATELVPGLRATMMAGFYGASGLGRVVGALAGGPLWLWGGIGATGALSVVTSLLAVGCLVWGLKGWGRNP
jgi:predicted MFS family arabinose efflux permease